MPFTLSCPGCDAKLKATEALVGKTIKCPRCSAPVRIEQPTAVATIPRMELPPARVEEPVEEAEYEDESVMREDQLDELPEADDEDDIEEAKLDDGRGRRIKKGKKRRPGAPTSDERMMAMFIYLLGIFTGFVGPLILWLVKREESKFIDQHGKEVLNFNITVVIAFMCLGMVGAPVVALTFGVGILIVVPLFMALHIYALVMIVLGAVKANRGEYYEFPVSIRLIK